MQRLTSFGYDNLRRGCPLLRDDFLVLEVHCWCDPSGPIHPLRTAHDACCMTSPDFSQLVFSCNQDSKFSCALTDPQRTRKILLIAEDALLSGTARVDLITSNGDADIQHFLTILDIHIWICGNLDRQTKQAPLAYVSNALFSCNLEKCSLILIPNFGLWEVLKVEGSMMNGKPFLPMCTDISIPNIKIESVHHLMCFCRDRAPHSEFGHQAHDLQKLDFVYFPCVDPDAFIFEGHLVMTVDAGLIFLEARELRRVNIHRLYGVPKLKNDNCLWHEMRVKVLEVFSCHVMRSPGGNIRLENDQLAFSGRDWDRHFGSPYSWDPLVGRWYES